MGVGVNVTDVPAQIVVAEALIVTDGVTVAFTVIVTLLDVAVVGEAQAAVDVITQVTTSPFAKVELLYVPPVGQCVDRHKLLDRTHPF